ncbi:MAG: murein transglycosylase, partial [Odoribacter sp.]|nr:murein transglycosylase [Odoribacter sp.]
MTVSQRRAVFTATIIIFTGIVFLFVTQGFREENKSGKDISTSKTDDVSRPYKLPDSISFAGERMPLENFDTRESLEREIIISAYRHSSTIMIIKRANRYFPVIEKILKEYNIPDDFKYIAVAESDLSNMISPAGATGYWQIMTETGKEDGIEINTEIDERYHIEKSTGFACRYFL